ncbi:MAG: acyl-CoA thioesterase, partial [Vicinamibacteria bacterium]|nr:acyl-CoA thioesterase [Vicinamibacteria bacterium]
SVSRVRVRFAETDKFGYAYHGAYFAWFEVGRTNLLRERGMTYVDLMGKDVHLPVISTSAEFLRPVAYDDDVEIKTTLAKVTGVRLLFEYELRIENDSRPLTRARTEHAAVDASGRPRRFPEDILRLLK